MQSTTLALMAAQGRITPMPDGAIFADTGDEPAAVYKHLAWLMEPGRLPFPIHVARAWEGYGRKSFQGLRLGDEILRMTAGHLSKARPPLFTLRADGSKGMIRRQCTDEYKIAVIERRLRELLGLKKGQRWPLYAAAEQWIGISTDEASRMKPSPRPAISHRWPLIELSMSRRDCLAWLRREGYPEPPKSACTFCPFHSDAQWREIRDTDPAGWARALKIDDAIRAGLPGKGIDGAMFLHSQRVPLRDADLSTAEDRGQLNLFENECAGVCGV